jgi:hypothetical protein
MCTYCQNDDDHHHIDSQSQLTRTDNERVIEVVGWWPRDSSRLAGLVSMKKTSTRMVGGQEAGVIDEEAIENSESNQICIYVLIISNIECTVHSYTVNSLAQNRHKNCLFVCASKEEIKSVRFRHDG